MWEMHEHNVCLFLEDVMHEHKEINQPYEIDNGINFKESYVVDGIILHKYIKMNDVLLLCDGIFEFIHTNLKHNGACLLIYAMMWSDDNAIMMMMICYHVGRLMWFLQSYALKNIMIFS